MYSRPNMSGTNSSHVRLKDPVYTGLDNKAQNIILTYPHFFYWCSISAVFLRNWRPSIPHSDCLRVWRCNIQVMDGVQQLGLPLLGVVAAAAVTFYVVSFNELREVSFSPSLYVCVYACVCVCVVTTQIVVDRWSWCVEVNVECAEIS